MPSIFDEIEAEAKAGGSIFDEIEQEEKERQRREGKAAGDYSFKVSPTVTLPEPIEAPGRDKLVLPSQQLAQAEQRRKAYRPDPRWATSPFGPTVVPTPEEFGTMISEAGRDVRDTSAAAAYKAAELVGGDPEAAFQQIVAPESEKPLAEDIKRLPLAGEIAALGAYGVAEASPRFALMALMSPAGAPAAGGFSFGFNEQGFSPQEAAIGAILPSIGKYSGEISGILAKRLGISNDLAMRVLRAAGHVGGPTAYLTTIQASEIAGLAPEDRPEAIKQAVASNVGFLALSFPGGVSELSRVTPRVQGPAATGAVLPRRVTMPPPPPVPERGVTAKPEILDRIIAKKATKAVAVQRIFPDLKLSIDEAQQLLDAANLKKGAPDARTIRETEEIHGPLRPPAVEGAGQMPIPPSRPGDVTEAARGIPEAPKGDVPLTPEDLAASQKALEELTGFEGEEPLQLGRLLSPEEIERQQKEIERLQKSIESKAAPAAPVPKPKPPTPAAPAGARREPIKSVTIDDFNEVLNMDPAEFAAKYPSFTKAVIAFGEKMTPEQASQLETLHNFATARSNAAREKAIATRNPQDAADAGALSSLPQFFNEALKAYKRTKGEAAPAALPEASQIAQELGMRYDAAFKVPGRWAFTLFDKEGKDSTTFTVPEGSTVEQVRKAYLDKLAEYGDDPNAPRPPKGAPAEPAPEAPAPVSRPGEVSKLGTSKTLNEFGDPVGTSYRATSEDWAEWQRLMKLPVMKGGKQDMTLLQAREDMKNKYGGMPPKEPAAPAPELAEAPAAPAAKGSFLGVDAGKWTPEYIKGLSAENRTALVKSLKTAISQEGLRTKFVGEPNDTMIANAIAKVIAARQERAAKAPQRATEPEVPTPEAAAAPTIPIPEAPKASVSPTPAPAEAMPVPEPPVAPAAAPKPKAKAPEVAGPEEPPPAVTVPSKPKPPTPAPETKAPSGETKPAPGATKAPEPATVEPAPPVEPPKLGQQEFKLYAGLPLPELAGWLKPLEKIRGVLQQRWQNVEARHRIDQLADGAETKANNLARQMGNKLRYRRTEEQDVAAAAVIAAGFKPGELPNLLALVQGKNPKAEAGIRYAMANFGESARVAHVGKKILDWEARYENSKGIDTLVHENYLPGIYDQDLWMGTAKPYVIGKPRGAGAAFKKGKTYDTPFHAVGDGLVPTSLKLSDMVEHRVKAGQRLVNRRTIADTLKVITVPSDGKPLAIDIPTISRGPGLPSYESLPPGYQSREVAPGVRFGIHEDFLKLFDAVTGQRSAVAEWEPGGIPLGEALLNVEGAIKHGLLVFDTFHASRILQKAMFLNRGKPGYKKGHSLLEYANSDLARLVADKEITQEMADWVRANRPLANMLQHEGLNVGRIQEAMYSGFIRSLQAQVAKGARAIGVPKGITEVIEFNKWVFEKVTRGAMLESAIIEFNRIKRQNPEWTDRRIARYVARNLNAYFGNLGRQGVFKSATMLDASRLAMLAPQWVESMARSEILGAAQLAKAPFESAAARRLKVGTLGSGLMTGAAAYVFATQLLNLATRGHLTFQNEEKGHKWDAWIPDVTGKGPGFFISPLSVVAELTHDMIRYAPDENEAGGLAKLGAAANHIRRNRQSPLWRSASILATGRDWDDRKIVGAWERAKRAAWALAPVPIPASPLIKGDAPQGQLQRQLTASAGFKTEPVKSSVSQINSIARDYMESSDDPQLRHKFEAGVKSDFGQSDYYEIRKALQKEDFETAFEEYQKLRATKKATDIAEAFRPYSYDEDGMPQAKPIAGMSRAETRKFLRSLTPQQRKIYEASRDELKKQHRRFQEMLRQAPRPKPAERFEIPA